MRTIEEIRPIVRDLFPHGIPIGLAQPFINICCPFFANEQRMKKHGTFKCPEPSDVDTWPAPQSVIDAGLTKEEWALFDKRS